MMKSCGPLTVREAKLSDIDDIKDIMRPEDVAEVWAAGHYMPEEVLNESFKASQHTWSIVAEGKAIAIFGLCIPNLMGTEAIVWMLTSTTVDRFGISFAKISKGLIAHLLTLYPVLYNCVDARYTRCIRWLSWCGAQILKPLPYGIEQMPFHPFVFRKG